MVDEYAAAVIRDIFRWKLEGASQQRIADRLNGRGELSPMEYKRFCGLQYKSGFHVKPKAKWTAVAIGRILRNEFYVGTLELMPVRGVFPIAIYGKRANEIPFFPLDIKLAPDFN